MTIGNLLAVLVILVLATLAAQFRWLPRDSALERIIFFLAGAGVSFFLYASGVPPKWFDGSSGAFGLAASLTLGAFIGKEGRFFRLPLLLGMGGVLLVLNFKAHL